MEGVTLFEADSEEQVEALLEGERSALGVVLPEGFDTSLQGGGRPEVTFISREEGSDEAWAAGALVIQVIEELSGREPVVRLRERALGKPRSEGIGSTMPDVMGRLGLKGYFVVLWVLIGITMNGSFLVPTLLVEEKETKTLDAMLTAPASYRDVVVGKMLVGMSYSVVTALVVMGLNDGFSGLPLLSILVVLVSSLAITLIGLLIGGLLDNLTALTTWAGFIMLPLMLPGMLAVLPLDSLGPLVNQLLQVVPTYHLVVSLSLALVGDGSRVWGGLGVLALQGLALFGIVVWTLRRREA
jgi:ABC-2 type transport system permease protein